MTSVVQHDHGAERYWDLTDLDALFGAHSQVIAPWPRAPRRKQHRAFDRAEIEALLRRPVGLTAIDPRQLWASQPWVLRRHADYYLTGSWERTGETSADPHAPLNLFPVAIVDHRGRSVIVSGHHRAVAALIEARPLLVRTAATDSARAVTPLLWWDPAVGDIDSGSALEQIRAGRRTAVPTVELACHVLERLGVEPDVARARTARVGALCSRVQ